MQRYYGSLLHFSDNVCCKAVTTVGKQVKLLHRDHSSMKTLCYTSPTVLSKEITAVTYWISSVISQHPRQSLPCHCNTSTVCYPRLFMISIPCWTFPPGKLGLMLHCHGFLTEDPKGQNIKGLIHRNGINNSNK